MRARATGRTGEAIHAYERHGMVEAADTREPARAELVDGWDAQRLSDPDKRRVILTPTNTQVRDLNLAARSRLRSSASLCSGLGGASVSESLCLFLHVLCLSVSLK